MGNVTVFKMRRSRRIYERNLNLLCSLPHESDSENEGAKLEFAELRRVEGLDNEESSSGQSESDNENDWESMQDGSDCENELESIENNDESDDEIDEMHQQLNSEDTGEETDEDDWQDPVQLFFFCSRMIKLLF